MIKIQVGNQESKLFTEEQVNQFTKELDIIDLGSNIYSVLHNHKSHEISISKIELETRTISLTIDGVATQVKYSTKIDLLLEQMGIDTSASSKISILKAPMPGLVVDWFVKEGDSVQAGDKLLILEAMKMENVIKSAGEGTIKKIYPQKGVAVEKNQLLIEFN